MGLKGEGQKVGLEQYSLLAKFRKYNLCPLFVITFLFFKCLQIGKQLIKTENVKLNRTHVV